MPSSADLIDQYLQNAIEAEALAAKSFGEVREGFEAIARQWRAMADQQAQLRPRTARLARAVVGEGKAL